MPFLRVLRVLRGSLLLSCLLVGAAQAAPYSDPVHGDFVIRDFRFAGGEVLPELKLHYFTLGTPARDANGRVTNAVLLLHGTYGKGTNFLTDGFAGELFGTGQPLDARRFYVIVPDNLGHGKSTKPSDGLRAKFPRYGYADMVAAQRRLVMDGLGVQHLRLIVGASMGGMHAWMWAVSEPDFMDAILPMVCLPDQIAGRNRMERRLIVDAIRNDPEWNGGDYAKQPQGLVTALRMVIIGAGSVKRLYLEAPTQEATDRLLDRQVQQRLQGADSNDFLYAWEASRDYDPGPGLERIRASRAENTCSCQQVSARAAIRVSTTSACGRLTLRNCWRGLRAELMVIELHKALLHYTHNRPERESHGSSAIDPNRPVDLLRSGH